MIDPADRFRERDAQCERWLRNRLRDDLPRLPLEQPASERLLSWLREKGPTYLVLSGPVGVGKSVFLAQFLASLGASSSSSEALVLYDLADQTEHFKRADVVAELLQQLRSVSATSEVSIDGDPSTEEQFEQECAAYVEANAKPIWIFVDRLQAWGEPGSAIRLPRIPTSSSTSSCKCVALIDEPLVTSQIEASSRTDFHRSEIVRYESLEPGWFNRAARNQKFIGGFKDKFIAALAQRCALNVDEFSVAWDVASKLVCDKPPVTLLSIAIVCTDYLSKIKAGQYGGEVVELIKQVALSEPSGLATQVIQNCIVQLQARWDHEKYPDAAIWMVLGALALAREPVSADTLEHLGVWDRNDVVDQMLRQSFIRPIEGQNSSDPLLEWAWPVYRDVCNAKLRPSYRQELNKKLATGCQQIRNERCDGPSFAYACRWTAEHLFDARAANELNELLADPVWLLDRIVHSSPNGLASDFRLRICQQPNNQQPNNVNRFGTFIVEAMPFLEDVNSVKNRLTDARERLAARLLSQLSACESEDLESYVSGLLKQPHASWLQSVSQYPKPVVSTASHFEIGEASITSAFLDAAIARAFLGTVDGRIVCIDVKKGEVLCVSSQNEDPSDDMCVIGVYRQTVSTDRLRYISVRSDHKLNFWEFREDEPDILPLLPTYVRQDTSGDRSLPKANCCALARTSNCVVVGADDGWVTVWELQQDRYSLKRQFQITSESHNNIRSITVMVRAGQEVLVAGGIWGIAAATLEGQPICVVPESQAMAVNAVLATDDGCFVWVLYAYSRMKTLRFDESLQLVEVPNSQTGFCLGSQLQSFSSPDLAYLGRADGLYTLAAVCRSQGFVWIVRFDPTNIDRPVKRPKLLTRDTSVITCIASEPQLLGQGDQPALLVIGDHDGRYWTTADVLPDEEITRCAVSRLVECRGYFLGVRENGDVFGLSIEDATPLKIFTKKGKRRPIESRQPIVAPILERQTSDDCAHELFVAREDGTIELWSVDDGALVTKGTIQTNLTEPCAVRAWRSDEGRCLLVNSKFDDQVALWNFDLCQEMARTPAMHTGVFIESIELSHDFSRMAVWSSDDTVHIYDFEGSTGLKHVTAIARIGAIAAICFGESPDDLLIATTRGKFQLHEISSGEFAEGFADKTDSRLKRSAWYPAGELFLTESQQSLATIYPDCGELVCCDSKPFAFTNLQSATAQESTSARTVMICSDMRVRVFELSDRRFHEVAALGMLMAPTCCAITCDGSRMAVGDRVGGVHILSLQDASQGEQLDTTTSTTLTTGNDFQIQLSVPRDTRVLNIEQGGIVVTEVKVSGTGNIVNIAKYMTDVKNTINNYVSQSSAVDEVKQLIKTLTDQIDGISQSCDQTQIKKMGKNAEALSKELASDEPEPRWYELSLEGLKEAAIAVGAMATPILDTVNKLRSLLLG